VVRPCRPAPSTRGARTPIREYVRSRTRAVALSLLILAIVVGCGSLDPEIAPELSIVGTRLTQLTTRGVKVEWQTSEAATGRIDYGPTVSVTNAMSETGQSGIGLDCDGHIISEGRTNCEVVGPQVNSVVDYTLKSEHALIATEASTSTTFTIAISSVNARGQRAVLTFSYPHATSLVKATSAPR